MKYGLSEQLKTVRRPVLVQIRKDKFFEELKVKK